MIDSKDTSTWRFIETGERDGPFNMAADEVLANTTSRQEPVFRVYKWRPHTISIGYHQRFSEIDLHKCRGNNIGIVKRPTGGRAIFHAEEVTYSVVIPANHSLFRRRPEEIYNAISLGLVTGLSSLDPQIVIGRSKKPSKEFSKYTEKFACFATSARYEILFGSKKLVGSAQRRYEHGVLQHGSIMLGDEHLNLVDYLVSKNGMKKKETLTALKTKTISLSQIMGRNTAFEEILVPLKKGFEKAFGIRLIDDTLTETELEEIYNLQRNFTN